jgi:hypothetical protein
MYFNSIDEALKIDMYAKEIMIAYNFLFRYHINYNDSTQITLDIIKRDVSYHKNDFIKKKYKIDIIIETIIKNINEYMNKPFILSNYGELIEKIKY